MSTGLTDELSDGAIKKLRAFAALARSVTRQVDHARAYAEQRGGSSMTAPSFSTTGSPAPSSPPVRGLSG
jgi:hypothetical protein